VQQIKSCRRQLHRPKKLTLAHLKYASAFAAFGSRDTSVASPARCFGWSSGIQVSVAGGYVAFALFEVRPGHRRSCEYPR
jgi:hypothetical protein